MSGLRERRVLEVQRLRADGLTFKEIGEQLGLGVSTAHAYFMDPDGSKDRARKEKNNGVCKDCGGPTRNGGAAEKPERCKSCNDAFNRSCTRAWVLEAIREWADENGGVPPSAQEWNPSDARSNGRHDMADKWAAGNGRWPYSRTAQCAFGSWSEAIKAAGFEPRGVGKYGRDGEDPAIIAETVRLYESGLSTRLVGERLGVSASAISWRLMSAGVPRRSKYEAHELRQQREARERKKPRGERPGAQAQL